MSRLSYLAYGSNLHPERLRRRVPSAELVGTCTLEGFRLAFHKRGRNGFGCCTLVRGAGVVHGAIFAMDPEDKPLLDRHEGLGSGYTEERLRLPEHGEVFLYVAQATFVDAGLQPCSWYKALVLAGVRYHDFPESYRRAIDALAAARDPDEARHALHMELVRELERARDPR